MPPEKEKGASPDQAAPQAISTADCSTSPVYAIAPAPLECFACKSDVDPEHDVLVEVAPLGPGLSVAVGFCPACIAAALAKDGDTEKLFTATRANYLGGVAFSRTTSKPPDDAPRITLHRRGIGSHPRRHPAYGKTLAENPPPPDEPLTVAVGWQYAKTLPEPLLVVKPEDNPVRLRFDVADGRRVRVAHPADADPDRLLRLAQALIDYGALYVDLIEHPPRPGATKRERLRVLVEAPR